MRPNYKKGEKICTADDFAKQEIIYDSKTNAFYKRTDFERWQFRYVLLGVESGRFYKVRSKDERSE